MNKSLKSSLSFLFAMILASLEPISSERRPVSFMEWINFRARSTLENNPLKLWENGGIVSYGTVFLYLFDLDNTGVNFTLIS